MYFKLNWIQFQIWMNDQPGECVSYSVRVFRLFSLGLTSNISFGLGEANISAFWTKPVIHFVEEGRAAEGGERKLLDAKHRDSAISQKQSRSTQNCFAAPEWFMQLPSRYQKML